MKNLKFMLLLSAALGITSFAKAQTNVTFGVKAGANYTELYGKPGATNRKGDAGFNAGVFARVGNRLFFEPGVNFQSFGSKFDYNNSRYESKFSQLQLPLLIGYQFISHKEFNFHGAIGPQGDFNFSRPQAINGNDYKKFNTSGRIELGVDVGHFVVDAGYAYTLSPLNSGINQKAGIYSLAVGVHF